MPYLTEHLNLRSFLAGLFLALIGAVCFALIILAQNDTQALIAHNRAAQEQEIADTLLPPEVFGSSLTMDCYLISDPRIGQNMKLYAAREGDKIKGYILQYSTARGYSNPLVMISSFNANKSLYRADIQFSRETPGIGDKLDRRHGTFLDALSGKNLENVKWDVKKFGGDFDYVTGATVTSRALILASRDALQVLSEADLNRLKKCRVKR